MDIDTHTRARWFITTSITYIRAPINFKQVVQYPVFVEWVWPSLKLIWWVGQFPLSICPSLGYLWPMTRPHDWGLISADGSVTFSLWRDCHLATKLVANCHPEKDEKSKRWSGTKWNFLTFKTSPMYSFMVLMFLAHSCTCSHMQIEIKATSQWPPSKWSLVRIPRVSLLLNWDLVRFVQIYV